MYMLEKTPVATVGQFRWKGSIRTPGILSIDQECVEVMSIATHPAAASDIRRAGDGDRIECVFAEQVHGNQIIVLPEGKSDPAIPGQGASIKLQQIFLLPGFVESVEEGVHWWIQ